MGDPITLDDSANDTPYVRPAGADFQIGDAIRAPRLLTPSDVALLAAMNIATFPSRAAPSWRHHRHRR